jgi:dihydrodipicolinate synthase/N-acetylneuraminate lyase
MLRRKNARGFYVLMPTPFSKSGQFDEAAFRQNVRNVCEYDVQGIATTGTLGEFHTIPWKDHQRLITALVEETKAGIVTIPGCSGMNTDEVIMKTKFAQDAGADAVMNTVPFYARITKDECVKYWNDVAEACPEIGLLVYNNPETTKFLIDARTFVELAKIPSVCGTKEIVGYTPLADFTHWMNIVHATDLAYFCCDPVTVAASLYDAAGVTSENFALWPKLFLEVYKACLDKDWEKAKKLHYEQMEFVNFVYQSFGFGQYNWFCVLKAALDKLGIIKGGYPRRPFIPVPESIQKKGKELVVRKYGDRLG